MNRKLKEKQAADNLAQPANGKHPYVSPQWNVIPIEQTSLICTSMEPKPKETTEEEWENEWKEGDWTEF